MPHRPKDSIIVPIRGNRGRSRPGPAKEHCGLRNRLLRQQTVDERELFDIVALSSQVQVIVPVRRYADEFRHYCAGNGLGDIVSIRSELPHVIAIDQVESALLPSRNE